MVTVIALLNRCSTVTMDAAWLLLGRAPGWLALVIVSFVFSVLALVVFKFTSNQKTIERVKAGIKADILAIKLFKDDLGVMFRALLGVWLKSLRLLQLSLVPVAVMAIPFVLLATQLALRFQWRPLNVGETIVCTAELSPGVPVADASVRLAPGEGVAVETPPLRIAGENSVIWRLRATGRGAGTLAVHAGDGSASIALKVDTGFQRLTPRRSQTKLTDLILYPGTPPIPATVPIRSISLAYPTRDDWLGGSSWWLVWLIALSLVFAFPLKRVLRVEF